MTAKSLSVAVIVTVCDSSGPSVLTNDQLQAPLLPLSCVLIVPVDAVIVTSSVRSTSLNVPVLATVWPSSTVTAPVFTATVGPSFSPVMVIVTVAKAVSPKMSSIWYSKLTVVDSPTASDSNWPSGSKVKVPS